MIKLKASDAVEQLAGVMGWEAGMYSLGKGGKEIPQTWSIPREGLCPDSILASDFNPLRPQNLHQAFEALEAWCDSQEQSASLDYNPEHTDWTSTLYTTVPHAKATHKSLNYAVCQAILSAECKKQVRIVE